MIDTEVLANLLDRVRPIARAAGEAIRRISLEPGDVTDKADGSPLTRADLASHTTIMSGLSPLEPKLPILSEEAVPDSAARSGWDTFWCVDPLDGTKEFIKGLPDYTVNIAIIENAEPILGVIYVPARDQMYYAARGIGALKVDAAGAQPAPIAASAREHPTSAVVSRSHLSAETEEFLARLGVAEMVKRGSSAKICAVAEGAADIYPRFGPTCLWDTAAGAAIARQAGCRVVDLGGKDLSYDLAEGLKRPGFIVCPAGMDLPELSAPKG